MYLRYDEEHFQDVEVCGIRCQLSDMRIDASSLPKGKYKYEVAGDDESDGEAARVQKGVMCNFWGTLISDEPLPVDEWEHVLWLAEGDFMWL